MRIYTKIVMDMMTGTLLESESYEYYGPLALSKGASQQQKDLEQQQADFSKTLMGIQQQAFGAQQALFGAIRSVYDPIIAAGPNQYGFNDAEDRALRTQASEGTAAQFRQAGAATAEKLAASGGGNSFLPSGVNADIQGKIAGAAAGQESSQQLGITKAGYEVGRENFNNATGVEMGVAAGYNPLGYAGAATAAGRSAFDMASEIQKANQAASPWGTIGGLVGGIAGSFAGPFGAAIGSKVGGFLGNAGSGNGGGQYLGSASSGSNNWGGFGAGESYT